MPGVGVELFPVLILRNLLILSGYRTSKIRKISQCGHVVGTPNSTHYFVANMVDQTQGPLAVHSRIISLSVAPLQKDTNEHQQ